MSLDGIINEAKRIGVCLIPFGFITSGGLRILKSYSSYQEGSKRSKFYTLFGGVVSGVTLAIPLMYSIISFDKGSFDYKKWPELRDQRIKKEETERRTQYKVEFEIMDANNNKKLSTI